MHLSLSSKLNPFSAFSISLGPLYAERLFECLLQKEGVKCLYEMTLTDKFESCIDWLKTYLKKERSKDSLFVQFYLGYFYQLISSNSEALHYYQSYLVLTKGTEESRYYAQWQTGILLDRLNYSWPVVRESLAKANAIDPLRGEPIKYIIQYYIQRSEWEKAYPYSNFAKKHYFKKNPIAIRRWYVDFDSYNGSIMDTHILICNKLGLLEEAERTHIQLLNYVIEHIHEFAKVEKYLIQMVNNLYHKPANKQTLLLQ